MGRSLTNTMVNTGIETEFEEAIYEVGCAYSANNTYDKTCTHFIAWTGPRRVARN